MARKSVLEIAWIAPGMAVRTKRLETIGEAYRRLQRDCKHEKRDLHGRCYQCGDRKEVNR